MWTKKSAKNKSSPIDQVTQFSRHTRGQRCFKWTAPLIETGLPVWKTLNDGMQKKFWTFPTVSLEFEFEFETDNWMYLMKINQGCCAKEPNKRNFSYEWFRLPLWKIFQWKFIVKGVVCVCVCVCALATPTWKSFCNC